VIAHVRPAQAQPVDALPEHAAQVVPNLAALSFVAQRARRRCAQAQPRIHAPQQQCSAFAAQIPATEVRLDNSPSEPSEIKLLVRTLWHRQSSVGIGGEIPMATRLGTRLPTSTS
jgi:hypothetical protein